jgi:ATP-dependent DNA ligase
MPGAPNRWSGGRGDQSWVALRIERVAEVKYEAMLNGRFRGTTRFVRWRDDRTPESCRYDQIEVPLPVGLSEILTATP